MDTTKPTLKGKRILVTGAQGYLGSRLVDVLKNEQARVFCIDIKNSSAENSFCVDLSNKEDVQNIIDIINPNIIFHLAANLNREHNFDKHDEIMQANYHGTMNLLSALKDHPYENFVFTSTSEIYGSNLPPFTEDMLPKPVSPYSLSKYFAEIGIQTFSKTYNKNYTILRLFNFIGKDMPSAFFVPQLIEALKNRKAFQMTKGEQKRDFIHIDDLISTLLKSSIHQNTLNQIFNVCSGKSYELRTLAEDLKFELNSSSYIDFGAIPYRNNEIWDMTGNNKKICAALNIQFEQNIVRKLIN